MIIKAGFLSLSAIIRNVVALFQQGAARHLDETPLSDDQRIVDEVIVVDPLPTDSCPECWKLT
jgi:hypothetical protein